MIVYSKLINLDYSRENINLSIIAPFSRLFYGIMFLQVEQL